MHLYHEYTSGILGAALLVKVGYIYYTACPDIRKSLAISSNKLAGSCWGKLEIRFVLLNTASKYSNHKDIVFILGGFLYSMPVE